MRSRHAPRARFRSSGRGRRCAARHRILTDGELSAPSRPRARRDAADRRRDAAAVAGRDRLPRRAALGRPRRRRAARRSVIEQRATPEAVAAARRRARRPPPRRSASGDSAAARSSRGPPCSATACERATDVARSGPVWGMALFGTRRVRADDAVVDERPRPRVVAATVAGRRASRAAAARRRLTRYGARSRDRALRGVPPCAVARLGRRAARADRWLGRASRCAARRRRCRTRSASSAAATRTTDDEDGAPNGAQLPAAGDARVRGRNDHRHGRRRGRRRRAGGPRRRRRRRDGRPDELGRRRRGVAAQPGRAAARALDAAGARQHVVPARSTAR